MKYLFLNNYEYIIDIPTFYNGWKLVEFSPEEKEYFCTLFQSCRDYYTVYILPKGAKFNTYTLTPKECHLIDERILPMVGLAFVDEGEWQA